MLTRVAVLFLIILTASCQHKPVSKNPSLTPTTVSGMDASKFKGAWIQPNPINEKQVQGFNLKIDGTAESINMATLKYKSWFYVPDTLILVAESIGNKVSSVDTLKYQVTKITDKELELKTGRVIQRYKKQ